MNQTISSLTTALGIAHLALLRGSRGLRTIIAGCELLNRFIIPTTLTYINATSELCYLNHFPETDLEIHNVPTPNSQRPIALGDMCAGSCISWVCIHAARRHLLVAR